MCVVPVCPDDHFMQQGVGISLRDEEGNSETQAATRPATIALGVGGVKVGNISILEGANQQSFLCLPV